jgi:hypothetical protein
VNDAQAASDRNLPDFDTSVARPDPVDVGQAAPTVPLYAGVARKP